MEIPMLKIQKQYIKHDSLHQTCFKIELNIMHNNKIMTIFKIKYTVKAFLT